MGRARPQECMMELLTSNYIVCSRFRGNDERGAGEDSCQGSGGVPQSLFSSTKSAGHRGLTCSNTGQVTSLTPTRQTSRVLCIGRAEGQDLKVPSYEG
jgi:hypothetical protein